MTPLKVHAAEHSNNIRHPVLAGSWAESPELLVRWSVSWTTDFAEAEAFLSLNSASRLRGQQPFHLRAEIDFAQILMVFAHECEAIIDPDLILRWEEVGSPIVERYRPLAAFFA
ncbi:hypothetical protein ACLBKT_07510 [Erythrobacter sp. W302b]|uniref:hypothetical protein n=1 Tax=Erythrobacter sp. W302b TaxID=3389874 RepID=UPI00396B3B26